MLRPSPNHGTQRLPNDDDDDRRSGIFIKFKSCLESTGHIWYRRSGVISLYYASFYGRLYFSR